MSCDTTGVSASFRFIYMTAGSLAEARLIAQALVAERLAACVNLIDGMESHYEWEGEVQTAREIVLIAKTRADLFDALKQRVLELHSYDCPCVVALDLSDGHPKFLKWIAAQTGPITPPR